MKLGMLLAMLLGSIFSNAQSKPDKTYYKYTEIEGVTSLSFSKSAIDPFDVFIDDNTKKDVYIMKKI